MCRNREAVRRYRQRKKAAIMSMEEEVAELRARTAQQAEQLAAQERELQARRRAAGGPWHGTQRGLPVDAHARAG